LSRGWIRVLAGCVALLAAVLLPSAAMAAQSPGDPTLQIKVGDDVAGGKTDLTFERVYSGRTPADTPVYIYVPQGGIGHPEVNGINPQFDPNPNDGFKPCADNAVASHTISQAQINTLGDELAGHIVGVDEAHYMPIAPADPANPASKALVVLAYNIIDGAYYDCAADQYTVGYFAPDFLADYGMNTIVIDTGDWGELVGNPDTTDLTMEGVIAHELQHLLHNQSDAGEMSWVDEGLADFAIFLNGYPVGGSHATYHQVFHRETSLTRWGGGLENYGASFTFFQYLWEQAGGNGDGTYNPDGDYDAKGGDLLIKKIFENQADGVEGVQAAIAAYNAATGAKLRSARELFEDWAVTVYLDDERSSRWNIRAFDFGDPATTAWTIDLANNEFFGGRDVYQGAVPYAKYQNRAKKGLAGNTVALPYSTSYQSYRNPGPTFSATLDGADTTTIAPHTGAQHWYAGYESQSDNVLDVAAPAGGIGGQKLDFWDWHFIEEGWDYGFVEALVGGQWVTVPLTDDAGKTVTTNTNPQGNNTEGNGLTGTSGGAYFVDEPKYIHLTGVMPAGATDVRLRYSTDAAYLDTGWFVDDVKLGGVDAALSSGDWFLTDGKQDDNWILQVIAPCDLTPSGTTAGELVDNAGNHVYRFEGDDIRASGFNSKCLGQRRVTTVISNLPTGDLQVLDAPYTFSLRK
jgi:hypothetical protein